MLAEKLKIGCVDEKMNLHQVKISEYNPGNKAHVYMCVCVSVCVF